MEKAIIIGAFENFGFHLCKTILEEGIEVEAIHLDETRNPLTEERRLEIGRNANFTESDIEHFNPSLLKEKGTILFLDYTEQITRDQDLSTEMVEKLHNLIEEIPEKGGKIVWLLPLFEFHRSGNSASNITNVMKFIKKQHIPFQLFYFSNIDDITNIEMKKNMKKYISELMNALIEIVVD